MQDQEQMFRARVGPVDVDWAVALGYYTGLGAAVAFELIAPPLAVFIACVPFLNFLRRPGASAPARFVSEVLDGAAKPVGGDGESAIRVVRRETRPGPARALTGVTGRIGQETGSIWAEARALADKR